MYLFIIYTMLRNHGTGFSSSESHLQPECVQHFQRGRLPLCLVRIELACREEGTLAPSLVSEPGTLRAVTVVHSGPPQPTPHSAVMEVQHLRGWDSCSLLMATSKTVTLLLEQWVSTSKCYDPLTQILRL